MKFRNNKTIFFIIGVLLLIILGATFALTYGKNINIEVDTAQLGVDYSGTLTLPSVDLVPINDNDVATNTQNVMRINFAVKGAPSNPNMPIIYDVILSDLVIDDELKSEYLKWQLNKNGTKLSEGSFSPDFDSSIVTDSKLWLSEIQQDLPTYNQAADSYVFIVWLSESCQGNITACDASMDQSDMLGKSISGKIETILYTNSKKALVR